ncbi:MAG: hypothetical protein JXA71_10925, partial [Chitinispirillaceae bacterium]|nr:hypothetical protein [Chitinispirillaceae bacterium]
MQKIALIALFALFCSLAANADQTATQRSHPKKAYLDPVRNKVFWPLEKPVWVRLAESADKNAPSYLLTKENDSTGAHSGIRLDISGSQFIRWKNYLTGDSVKLRFVADGEAPECHVAVTGEKTAAFPTDTSGAPDAPRSITSRPLCYAKKVMVAFSGKDRLSGIDSLFYSVNNGPFETALKPVLFDKEGVYRIAFYAVDRVGNSSAPDYQTFSIDATPPVTSLVFNGRTDERDTVFSRSQSVSFAGVDTVSGIREIRYRFNNDKKFDVYKKPVPLRELKDGLHTIYYHAIDNAGNEEQPRSRTFIIDDIPPVPVISFDGDRYTGSDGQEYISPRTVVTIAASDDKSGIGKIEYAIENADFIPYTSPFRFSPQLKKCAIEVRVTDKAGNVSRKHRASAHMDARPPKSSYSITGPLFQKSGVLYITAETRITLSARDEGSGVGRQQYRINDSAVAATAQPIALTQEGRHLFRYWSVD